MPLCGYRLLGLFVIMILVSFCQIEVHLCSFWYFLSCDLVFSMPLYFLSSFLMKVQFLTKNNNKKIHLSLQTKQWENNFFNFLIN